MLLMSMSGLYMVDRQVVDVLMNNLMHEEERKKPWLKKNSPAHDALRKIIMDKCLLNTLKYYTNFRFVYTM